MLENAYTEIRPRKHEDVIWYLLRIQRSPGMQIMAAAGFLLLFYIPYQSLVWGGLFLFSMWWHEFGHWIVFRISGIKSILRLIFPLGAVAVPADDLENKRSDELPHLNLAWLMQAGLIANVLLLAIGWVIVSNSHDEWLVKIGRDLMYINTFLAFFNILPIWKLDARLFWKIIFSTLKEKQEKYVTGAFVVVAFVSMVVFFVLPHSHWSRWLLTIINNIGWWLLPMVVATGIWTAQGNDDPKLAYSNKAMTKYQVALQLLVYELLTVFILFMGVGQIKWFE